MELNEINSSNMTDKIVESMNETEDEPLYTNNSMKVETERINVDCEEDDGLYEDYGNEDVYEEYNFEGDYEQYS